MSLEAYLRNLHASPRESGPSGWQVDWEDAPLKYKLYRGLPAVPLCAEAPLALAGRSAPASPDLTSVGHMLWYMYGLTQLSQVCVPGSMNPGLNSMHLHRRFVPSGGGLYPNELYVYLKIDGAPEGIYHYDAAHHRLLLLRQGNFDPYMERALGNRCRMRSCFAAIFISTVFWKNYYKYNQLAYRLQGLDTGALIGQTLEVADRFGYTCGLYYQFLDRAVHRLLGLAGEEESVYAIIPLSAEPADDWFLDGGRDESNVRAAELGRELDPIRPVVLERSRNKKPYPMLVRMNEASMLDHSGVFRQVAPEPQADSALRAVYLPRTGVPEGDLADKCRRRQSPEAGFVMSRQPMARIGGMLQEAAARRFRSDLDAAPGVPASRVQLYGCFTHVEGVPDGAYRYDPAVHALQRLNPGDHRADLQRGMYLDNVNLFQVPICLHVAGPQHFYKAELGYRGYRIQQMEAGLLIQRLLLAASSLGMGGRPLLGFDSATCDALYRFDPQGKTCLIQLPVGSYRPSARLEGGLRA
ncbi:SagB family peptide dehydrogenase [Paenibacillus sp. GCM10012303]|uniref:SagB family peptide dehydrogenase n=1 Tax=Paenibacillus sp. GCM10012303 TaxID=3317340 RepID=UPI0036176967